MNLRKNRELSLSRCKYCQSVMNKYDGDFCSDECEIKYANSQFQNKENKVSNSEIPYN